MFIQNKKRLIDILIEQDKIKKDVVSFWGGLSNSELEEKLKNERLVSQETISRAYATLYNLPFITLKNRPIQRECLEMIPKDLAQEFKILCYEHEKADAGRGETVHIAVAQPGKLSDNLPAVLNKLEEEKHLKVELAIVTLDDFSIAFSQYPATPEAIKPYQEKPASISITSPSIPHKTIELDKINIPYGVITKFPEDIALKYQMVVFESPTPFAIKVAVVDPDDKKIRDILDFIRTKNDIAIEEFKVTPSEINRAVRFYHPEKLVAPKPAPPPEEALPEKKPEEKEEIPPKEEEKPPVKEGKEVPEVKSEARKPLIMPDENDFDKFLGRNIKSTEDLQEVAESGHVPKIVAAAVILAVSKKASDIHIEPAEKNIRLRFRIDGLLRDVIKLPIDILPAIVSRVKILSKMKIDETRIPQDGRFDCIAVGHAIDLRIATLPTIHGEKLAMRILDKSAHLYTLEELGLAGRNLKVLLDNMNKPYGVILSTGPTGSGKTTTLYAVLNRISNASVNIITLEDPVEYEIAGINQCQIKPKIGFSFVNGLRSVLRQDPNIIMVGEIRDSETAALATHAALTGHLVLSTLHTNDAAGALPRIVDMGVEPFFLTSLINAIIGQRLVRKLCIKCKGPARVPGPIMKEIEDELAKFNLPKPYHFFEGRGCSDCELGYVGRVGIFEVLTMSQKLEELVLTNKPASELKNQAIRDGMVTMKQDGLIKALKGQTTINEVLRVITV